MHNPHPNQISPAEWEELASVRDVRENFGLSGPEAAADLASAAYGARFDFITGGPGYAGDLFVIMGDGLSAPPMVFIRRDSALTLIHEY